MKRKRDGRHILFCGLLAFVLAFSSLETNAQTGADPRINDQFLKADPIVQRERFEGESREVYHKRREVVAASAVKPGMTVADVGAGTGFFAILFAREVGPSGRVIAVEISRPFVAGINLRAKESSPSPCLLRSIVR